MKTILVVDDSESIRMLLVFSLEQGDYLVIEAENGRVALDILKESRVDLVITDLDMPEINGIDLIDHIRALTEYRKTPIIVLTNNSETGLKQKAKKNGANGWITKPFRPGQLLAVVNKFL